MYPALLIAFKLGGGLEIGFGQSFHSQMTSIFSNDGSLVSLLFIFGFIQLFRPFATHNLVFKGPKVFEPNKSGFLAILFFTPVFICFIGGPLIFNLPVFQCNYTTIIALGLNFLAYHTVCGAESDYRESQAKTLLIQSLVPFTLPKGLSTIHKIFLNKYNFNEQRNQLEFAELMAESFGLSDFARLVGDCKQIGNISPFINPINPHLDLRSKMDDFLNIRSAEW